MKSLLLLFSLALLSALSPDAQIRIGEIEFFGYKGRVDVTLVRNALPFHEGSALKDLAALSEAKEAARQAVKGATGRAPTDVAPTCCDAHGQWIVYIGLSGKAISLRPAPKGAARLSAEGVRLYQAAMDAVGKAAMKGATGEDVSKGYSLALDPVLRAIQLKMRDYALHHEPEIRAALASSSDPLHRAAAAELLGYAQASDAQIQALVRATRDADEGVRNNATRALLVLALSSRKWAGRIPPEGFVELLNSGTWTDLNKAGEILSVLTLSHNRKLNALLRSRALARLTEMARWQTQHARAARLILGRMAGIEESRLEQLADQGKVGEILVALAHHQP
jgi:hypothetical protein